MPSLRTPRVIVSPTLFTVLLLASAQLALSQTPPPPPPPGVRVQMPDKPDPTVKIPQFDVISVKPAKDAMTRVQFTPDGMRGNGVVVRFLLYEGFGGVNQNQVAGEPSWSTTDGFDIQAKVADTDVPTLAKLTFEQRRSMFQQILTDRFKLVAHHETRQLPVYELVVAKGGSRLKLSAPNDPAAAAPHGQSMSMGRGKVTGVDVPLSMLVQTLSRNLGRSVIDKTGLTANYDFTLEWTPDEGTGVPASGAPGPDQSGPDIFTAIQEQLGLKLESTKGPVDVVVIDHIEKPAEN